MKNQAFTSALAGILFGFSALLMFLNKEEPLLPCLLTTAGLLMIMHTISLKNTKTTCKKQ